MKKLKNTVYEPKKCWVGDKHKICYPDSETAEMSARLIEYDFGLKKGALRAYKCDFSDHWHLANKK